MPSSTSNIEGSASKDSRIPSCFKHCYIELHQWQLEVWARSKAFELQFFIHSSSWALLSICFNKTKPENHDSKPALQTRSGIEVSNCWNYAMAYVDLLFRSMLHFVELNFIENWMRYLDFNFDWWNFLRSWRLIWLELGWTELILLMCVRRRI